jgi:glycosyltransferase involved in cell wall biosynthesis
VLVDFRIRTPKNETLLIDRQQTAFLTMNPLMSPRILTALPVFNEVSHVDGVLDEVQRFAGNVLVVDDGSSDGTADVLAQRDDIEVVSHAENAGYGAALKSAFDYAVEHNYDVLVTIDCDGQHEPRLIPELASLVFADEEQPVDIVSGSRYLKQFEGDSQPPKQRQQVNMQLTALLNERFELSLTDAFCGFKAYRVDALSAFSITELGYAMPLQLWVQAVGASLRIVEFPVPLVYLEEERSFGGSLDDATRRMAYYRDVLERESACLPCGGR